MKRHFVIYNPAAGRGRGAKRWSRYRRLLDESLDSPVFSRTQGPGDERRLAAKAVDEGFEVIVAVGGDGTLGQVADVLVNSDASAALGVLPNGTGNDFARNLGIRPNDIDGAVRTLAAGEERRVDVGHVDTPSRNAAGEERESFNFLNLVGIGFDIAVIKAATRKKWIKGEALYKVTALEQLLFFPGIRAEITGGGEQAAGESLSGKFLMVTVTNATYFGGGFPIAPGARADDGALHLCAIFDSVPIVRMRLFGRAGKGRHGEMAQVRLAEDTCYRVSCAGPLDFEADGELRHAPGGEVRARIIPGALRAIAPDPDGW